MFQLSSFIEPFSFINTFRQSFRSIEFYSQQLGLNLDQQHLPAFAQVSGRNFKLILSGPGASGSRPLPNGERQEPG